MQSNDHLSAADSVAPFGSVEASPCPFCGEALKHHSARRGDDYYEHPRNDCVLAISGMGDPHIVFDDAEHIAAWNRRASPSPSGSGPTDEDAKRYRWLCEKLGQTELPCLIERITRDYVADYKPSIDAAIDAAIQSKGNQHG